MNNNNVPLVSVIMPLYNSAPYLKDAIESVCRQSISNWELLIVNDASTDQSYSLAHKFTQKDKRIHLLSLSHNKGTAYARNIAIRQAKGRFIAFLDSDDIWYPQKLEKQLNFMQNHQSTFSFCAYRRISEKGKPLNHISVPHRLTYEEFLKKTAIGCLTVIYDTKQISPCFFNEELPMNEDFECWARILKQIGYADGLNEVLADYRVRNNSRSSHKLKAVCQMWKIQKNDLHITFFKRVWNVTNYILYAIRKKIKKYS